MIYKYAHLLAVKADIECYFLEIGDSFFLFTRKYLRRIYRQTLRQFEELKDSE